MGLGKEKGSTRINRYEQKVSAIGFDSLKKLADALDVPPAYLLADDANIADAILVLAKIDPERRAEIVKLLKALASDPAMLQKLARQL